MLEPSLLSVNFCSLKFAQSQIDCVYLWSRGWVYVKGKRIISSRSLKMYSIYLEFVTHGCLGSLITDLHSRVHTYIIGHYNPSVRIIDLVSHTTYGVGGYLIFEKLFMAILFTHRVFVRNLLRGNRRRNNFRMLFWCLAWDSNPGFSSNKPTDYLLDHGLHSDLKTSKSQMQYGGQVSLIKIYKPRPLYWIRHFEVFNETPGTILFAKSM